MSCSAQFRSSDLESLIFRFTICRFLLIIGLLVYTAYWQSPTFCQILPGDSKKDNSIEINGIPPECTKENLEAIFEEILEQEKNDDKLKIAVKEKIAKVLAKNIAIKKGKKIEQKEMKVLISNLFACDLPSISPNGKPTIINLALNDITKHF